MPDFDLERFGTKRWYTKDKRLVLLRDMGISHLANSYHMLRRNTAEMPLEIAKARVLGKTRTAKNLIRQYEQRMRALEELKQYITWRVNQEHPTGE